MPCNSVNMKMHQRVRIEVSTDDQAAYRWMIIQPINGWSINLPTDDHSTYQRMSYAQSTDDRISLKDIVWTNSSWSSKSDGSDTVKGWLDSTAHGNQPTVEKQKKESSILFQLDIRDVWRISTKAKRLFIIVQQSIVWKSKLLFLSIVYL